MHLKRSMEGLSPESDPIIISNIAYNIMKRYGSDVNVEGDAHEGVAAFLEDLLSMDTDNDGVIDYEELANVDLNGDGVIDRSELNLLREQKDGFRFPGAGKMYPSKSMKIHAAEETGGDTSTSVEYTTISPIAGRAAHFPETELPEWKVPEPSAPQKLLPTVPED
eukprot:CAMPEP_0185753916 /NCGR_PEP_ID=MMETSP1174-20130828/12604_1 /TAXON_ID=35687 /ORGANISM="Dictyocha speculum, Strain CCMP1381" /LENGTH=164 /DNA_ID=CAMNT_0028431943 /DNA_START=84 /DNA_END=578 /DNA_ORIENTATION=-